MNKVFSKRNLIIGLILSGLGVLGAASQTWVTFAVNEGVASKNSFSVTGSGAYVSLVPMALSVAIGAIVLTIVPKFLRALLSLVLVLLGAGISAVSIIFLQMPLFAGGKEVTKITGISTQNLAFILNVQSVTLWPIVTLAVGILTVILALITAVVSWRWQDGGKKYDAASVNRDAKKQYEDGDRVSEWDRLTRGEDPS